MRKKDAKLLDEAGPVSSLHSALASPALEPAFWPPSRAGAVSAWWGHVPFAHWLVTASRPDLVVELGTHHGVSFSTFCEAMQRGHIQGRCYAVDTWSGDKHSGLYDESVFRDLASFIRGRYGEFAELIRRTFDDALAHFDDGSVDLLHIDGLHTYDAVKSDFEKWRPKLSKRGIVLIHDTNARRDDFGVWRFWSEVRRRYPSFEFLHDHGLGIVAVGQDPPRAVAELCRLDSAASMALRDRFAQLGARWVAVDAMERTSQEVQNLVAQHAQRIEELNRELANLEAAREHCVVASAARGQRILDVEAERERITQLASERLQHISDLEAERERMTQVASERLQRIADLQTGCEHLAQLSAERLRRLADLEAEREQLEQLSSARLERIAELDAERERLAQLASEHLRRIADLDAERERAAQLASEHLQRIADLEAERERMAEISSERLQRIAELEAERERMSQLSSEHLQRIGDLQAEHEQLTQLSAERLRRIADLEAERERLAKLSLQHRQRIGLQGERERLARLSSEHL